MLEEESQVDWPLVCEVQGLLVGQPGILEEKVLFVGTPFCSNLPACNSVEAVGEVEQFELECSEDGGADGD